MTSIAIIRHGSTAWNKAGRMQGSTDIPLDDDGIEQAVRLGKRLAGEDWDVIFTSHLARAKKTGEIIAEITGLSKVEEDARLREVNGGQTEGTCEEDRIAKWGADWRQLELGIEPPSDVCDRGMAFMNDLLKEYKGKKILIVSHGGFIKHMVRRLVPDFTLADHLRNTSLTRFTITDEGWNCDLFNCTAHLDEIEIH